MAGGAVIGALRVVLGADTAALDKGLKESQSSLAAFGASVSTGMAAAAAAVAVAAVAIGAAMQSTINDMDKLSKTSQKLGVPVEQLSALAYAADLSDVSFEALSKSVGKLNKTMVEAAAKPTSEAANAFRALGVSVTDSSGKLKSSDEVMAAVAEKFAGLKDGAGKTAAAMAIFGRTGADLIPLLNGGRDGLREMSDEATAFGAIVSTKAAKEAESFNDNITRLGYAMKGVFVQSVSAVLPTLVEVSNQMVEAAKNSGILEVGINIVSTAMKGLVSAGVIVGAVFKTLAEYISTVSAALSMVIKGEFTAAFNAVKGGVSGVAETATTAFGTIDRLWKGTQSGADAAAASTTKAATAQKDFNFAAMGGKNAVDQFIASQTKSLASQQAEIATFGLLSGAKEAMKLQLQADTIARQNNTTVTAAQQLQLDLLKQKTIDYGLTLQGLQLQQANLTPAQLFQQEQLKIQTLFDNGKISAETYGAAMQKVAEQAGASWDIAGASMAGSFKDIASAFGKESSGMATAAKIFGAIQATISMFTGAAKALELPFPANIAAMAAVLAKGASLVASIKGQSVPTGMMTGGSMMVKGGGGPDSVPVSLMASPGEQIDIWRPEQGGGQDPRRGAGSSSGKTIIMQGMVWGRDQIRDLVDALNKGDRDGIKLEFAT
jgi:hypothetical protein